MVCWPFSFAGQVTTDTKLLDVLANLGDVLEVTVCVKLVEDMCSRIRQVEGCIYWWQKQIH